LRQLEGKQLAGEGAKPRGLPGAEKYDSARQGGNGALLGQAKAYDAGADVVMAEPAAAEDGKKEKKEKKKKVGCRLVHTGRQAGRQAGSACSNESRTEAVAACCFVHAAAVVLSQHEAGGLRCHRLSIRLSKR
jgi:hypothetical protein